MSFSFLSRLCNEKSSLLCVCVCVHMSACVRAFGIIARVYWTINGNVLSGKDYEATLWGVWIN